MELKKMERLSTLEPEDLSKYKFMDYANDNFRDDSPVAHKRGSLTRPLHFQTTEHNYEAALTMYHVIQRFMFDLPEPNNVEPNEEEDNVFMRTLARNGDYNEGTFQRKMDSVKAPGWTSIPPLSTMSRPTTNMEKVRFVCSYGMYCADMRDEIYNQICIQLTNNPSKTSRSRGWILMAVCVGCFLPSEKFRNYLWNFIRQGPQGFADYCEKKLIRTMNSGCRKLAATLLELHASKVEGKIMLPITTMDSVTYECEVDSSTTCEELLNDLKTKLGMKSIFGFSVFARQFDQVFNWGSGGDNVMDVVSLCEQYAMFKNVPDEDRDNWNIFVRKDVFLPSHNAAEDPVETGLIYSQIMGGIHVGEYRCSSNDELSGLLAKRYYIEYGKTMDDENLGKIIDSGAPPEINTQDHMQLARLIRAKFQTISSITDLAHSELIKQEVVRMATSKTVWAKNFSRIINAQLISGPKVPKGDVRVFFNRGGIDLLGSTSKNGRGAFFLNLSLERIASITNDSPEMMKIKGGRFQVVNYLTIRTFEKSTYTFTSVRATEMYKLGNAILGDYKKGDANTIL